MKLSICRAASCLLVLLLAVQAHSTVLSYVVEQEVDQADVYVELTAKIQVDGTSLSRSIKTAEQLIEKVEKLAVEDCQKSSAKKDAKKCSEIMETSKFEVEPKYHLVRKVPTFTLFILTHKVTLQITNLKGLGRLIDHIIAEGQDLITLQELAWKTQDETDPEVTSLKDGLAEGKELCKKVGQDLHQVLSVEEVQEPEVDEEEEDEKDPHLTEAEVEKVIFKFKVVCGEKSKDSKAKDSKPKDAKVKEAKPKEGKAKEGKAKEGKAKEAKGKKEVKKTK